jgi:elongation of very long chain fatty acids protein 4
MDHPLVQAYVLWAEETGDAIVEWARDGVPAGPTSEWFGAGAPFAFAVAAGYFAFVVLGSGIMSVLPAMDKFTYAPRFVYNLLQMTLCSYMFIEAGTIAYRQGYSLMPCNNYSVSSPPVGNLLWLFYMSKILDFLDTFFIVTGRKWRQLSFLHVYHHITIFLFYWLNLNAGYDGDVYLTIVLNGLIHAIMYTYYFVALHTKDIWWKQYMTLMQMAQFCCMITQATYLMVTGCQTYPPRITKVYCGYIVTLLVLFAQFYVSSFSSKKGVNGGKKGSGKRE